MINISIDTSKIDKDRLYSGKEGRKYLNITLDKLQTPDQYGNTHTVYMQQSKDERTAKAKKIYLGSGKEYIFEKKAEQVNTTPPSSNVTKDDLPF
jgi:hypothetical protein